MHSITVTKQTTLAELQTFAQAAGGNDKIRAKDHGDGTFTLYASDKSSTGVKNFFTDKRADRQAATRDAVTMVLTAVKGSHVDAAMQNVLQGLPQTGELRGTALQNLLGQAAAARAQGTATVIPTQEVAQLLHDAVETGNPDVIEAATAKLADKLATSFRTKPHDTQLDIVTSRGDAVKGKLMEGLAGLLADPGKLGGARTGQNADPAAAYHRADPQAQAILDAAYDKAVQNLSNRRLDANTIRLDDPTSATGFKDYTKVKQLAQGGYGAVDLYRAADGSEVALKRPILGKKDKAADKFDEAAKEIANHRAATAGNPANIVALKAALRTADGGLEIVLPMMPHGNAYEMAEKMHQLKDGAIVQPREATVALLSTLRDMGQGTAQLQANGVVSLDNKSMNVLIDANGIGQLSDFGTAGVAQGNVRSIGGRMVDNPSWLAPETIQGWENRTTQMTTMETQHKADFKAASTALKNAGLNDQERATALADLTKTQKAREEAANRFNVTAAADTWSFGVDLYKFLTNRFPFDDRFFSGIEDQVKSHATYGGTVTLPHGLDLGLSPTETREANRLLAGLLHPDPNQRMTIAQALQSPLFALPDVGSQAARDNIKLAAQS